MPCCVVGAVLCSVVMCCRICEKRQVCYNAECCARHFPNFLSMNRLLTHSLTIALEGWLIQSNRLRDIMKGWPGPRARLPQKTLTDAQTECRRRELVHWNFKLNFDWFRISGVTKTATSRPEFHYQHSIEITISNGSIEIKK